MPSLKSLDMKQQYMHLSISVLLYFAVSFESNNILSYIAPFSLQKEMTTINHCFGQETLEDCVSYI